MNTVNMFNTLHALPPYNNILISSIDARTCFGLDVRTYHIPGDVNVIANAISHNNLRLLTDMFPVSLSSLLHPLRMRLEQPPNKLRTFPVPTTTLSAVDTQAPSA
jgi:hypothetical protein